MTEKNKMFTILVSCFFLFSFSVSIIAPFFPTFAKTKGISEVIVGMIFSVNPIGSFFAALILGKILTNVIFKSLTLQDNRYQFMIVGLVLLSLGLFMFASTFFFTKRSIIVIGIFARALNGIVNHF